MLWFTQNHKIPTILSNSVVSETTMIEYSCKVIFLLLNCFVVFYSSLKQLCYYDSSLSFVLSPTREMAEGSPLLSCCVLHSWCCLQPGPLPLLLKLPFHCYPSDIIMTTITWINIWLSQKTISFFFTMFLPISPFCRFPNGAVSMISYTLKENQHIY